MNFQTVRAVFQLITRAVRLVRELARFAHYAEARAQLVCQRCADDKAARLDPEHGIHLLPAIPAGEQIDRLGE